MLRKLQTIGLVLVVGLTSITGCGSAGAPPTAQVKGKVTLNGEPVAVGSIYFVAPDKGFSTDAALSATGEYTITSNLPPATYKVFITRPRITKPPMPGEAAPPPVDFKVPDKYQTETTSGLTADIVAGENTKDFALQ